MMMVRDMMMQIAEQYNNSSRNRELCIGDTQVPTAVLGGKTGQRATSKKTVSERQPNQSIQATSH